MKRHTKSSKKNHKKKNRSAQKLTVNDALLEETLELVTENEHQDPVVEDGADESEETEPVIYNDAVQVVNLATCPERASPPLISFYSIHQKMQDCFVCARCFSSSCNRDTMIRHVETCNNQVPGKTIYSHGNLELREIDPVKEKDFCERLSLYGNLFLDQNRHSLFSKDQMFFVLLKKEHGVQFVVGLFTKTKKDRSKHILKLLVVFPQFQYSGYGRLLLDISHEMSKVQKFIGFPQYPWSLSFSNAFASYLTSTISAYFIEQESAHEENPTFHLTALAERTGLHVVHVVEFFIHMDWIILKNDRVDALVVDKEFMHQIQQKVRKNGRYIEFRKEKLKWSPGENFPCNKKVHLTSSLEAMGDVDFEHLFRLRMVAKGNASRNNEEGHKCTEPGTSTNPACSCASRL